MSICPWQANIPSKIALLQLLCSAHTTPGSGRSGQAGGGARRAGMRRRRALNISTFIHFLFLKSLGKYQPAARVHKRATRAPHPAAATRAPPRGPARPRGARSVAPQHQQVVRRARRRHARTKVRTHAHKRSARRARVARARGPPARPPGGAQIAGVLRCAAAQVV